MFLFLFFFRQLDVSLCGFSALIWAIDHYQRNEKKWQRSVFELDCLKFNFSWQWLNFALKQFEAICPQFLTAGEPALVSMTISLRKNVAVCSQWKKSWYYFHWEKKAKQNKKNQTENPKSKPVLHKITWFIWETYDEDVTFNDNSAKIKCAMTLGGYHLRIGISWRQKKSSMKYWS